jgi:UDP-2,4-diacetamido-2,4,6-trideoxy-beta-L-altropyranose hydrolase
MRVAIRVDASKEIGTGHLVRCVALAAALKKFGCEIRFVMRDLGLPVAKTLQSGGHSVELLPAPRSVMPHGCTGHAAWAGVDQIQDAIETAENIGRPDWVVVDHYAFDSGWHSMVRARSGAAIAAIDDLADRPLAADLIIDHNLHVDHRRKYAGIAGNALLLGGPRYALLSQRYADAPRYVPCEEVRSIGIFMGGVDLGNISDRVLQGIDLAGFKGWVELVSTSSNPNLAELRQIVGRRSKTEISVDLPDLSAFFAKHDLQIGAAGGATWERCCIGAPSLLLIVAENQMSVAPALFEQGIAAGVTPQRSLEVKDIRDAISALVRDPARRAILAERSRALVDGLGALRVAEAMHEHRGSR